jgi:hypothetical protein
MATYRIVSIGCRTDQGAKVSKAKTFISSYSKLERLSLTDTFT